MSIISRTRVILKTAKAKPNGFAYFLRDGDLTVAPETHFLGFGETHIGRVFALIITYHIYLKTMKGNP